MITRIVSFTGSNRTPPRSYPPVVIASKVIQEARRDWWFWTYAGGFALLAAAITMTATQHRTLTSSGGFGRALASLIALVQLVITLMSLTLGARQLSSERESKTLVFLLAHPVSRTQVLLGTFAGQVAAMSASVSLGFGVAGLFSALRGNPIDPGLLLRLTGLSCLLVTAMVAIGVLVSTLVQGGSAALGVSISVWFCMVFLGDLGLMGAAVATRLPAETLFTAALLNPIEAFRLATVMSLEGSLDALGPAGTYAVDTFGRGVTVLAILVLGLWTAVALGLSAHVFKRRDQA